MKPPSDDLFRLIRALTPAEKRYFRLWARRHVIGEENNYLELFDAISEQEAYDEAALRRQFRDRPFEAYFPVAKRYLFQQLTESLHLFHRGRRVSEEVKRDLHVAELLLDKDLTGPAKKTLKRCRKRIQDYGLETLRPLYLEQQRRLYDHRLNRETSEEKLAAWRQEWDDALGRLAGESRYAWLSSTLAHRHYRKISFDSEPLPPEAERLLGLEAGSEAEAPPTPRARLDQLRARSTYHFMRGEAAEAYECNRRLIELFDTNAALRQRYPRQYLTVLNNFLIDNQQLGRFDTLGEGLTKLRRLPRQREFRRIPNLPVRIFELGYLLELNACIARERFGEALQLAPDVESGLRRHGDRLGLHYRLTFYYLLAYVYFENRRFSDALTWINQVLEHPAREEVVGELRRFARLLDLLTHYELGHDELLPYRIQSVRRSLAASGKVYRTERWLLSRLLQLLRAAGDHERKPVWRRMREEVRALKAEETERRVFNYFDFERWVGKHG